MLGLTTNVEFGYWISKNKIIYGRPDDDPKNKYLDWLYERDYHELPIGNLKELLCSAIKLARKMDDLKQLATSTERLIEMVSENPQLFYQTIASSMTPQERHIIIQTLVNESCMSCTNGTCQVPYYKKVGLDDQGYPQGYGFVGWENPQLIGKSKVLQKNDIYTL